MTRYRILRRDLGQLVGDMVVGEPRLHRRRYDACVCELERLFAEFRDRGCAHCGYSVRWRFLTCGGACPLMIELN